MALCWEVAAAMRRRPVLAGSDTDAKLATWLTAAARGAGQDLTVAGQRRSLTGLPQQHVVEER